MNILDTNVIAELMRANPEPIVLAWLRDQPVLELATTTINLAEISYGLARLPFGRRRSDLDSRLNRFVLRGFGNRVLDFDAGAAEIYGEVAVVRERAGRRLEGFDGLIAAIAKSRLLPIVTRNIGDFEGLGIDLINPWSSGS